MDDQEIALNTAAVDNYLAPYSKIWNKPLMDLNKATLVKYAEAGLISFESKDGTTVIVQHLVKPLSNGALATLTWKPLTGKMRKLAGAGRDSAKYEALLSAAHYSTGVFMQLIEAIEGVDLAVLEDLAQHFFQW